MKRNDRNRELRVLPALFLLLMIIGIAGCKEDQQPSDVGPVDSLQVFRDSFAAPEICGACHPTHLEEWQTSMHAYAIKDPVFLRLTEIGQERSGNELDQFCVKCHTPLGSALQETPPGFSPDGLTSLAAGSIHCDVCHRIDSFVRGTSIGEFNLNGLRKGPISDPAPNGFHGSEFDSRYIRSEICSPCHDILSPNGFFVEKTSTEWDLSPYSAMGLECQNCHMPLYAGAAAVGGPMRENLHRHFFVGVDYPLTEFPGKTGTIAMVEDLLKNSVAMSVDASGGVGPDGSLNFSVDILNSRTGHNIPSGSAFERQMWVEVKVTDRSDGSLLFSSGLLDDNLDLRDHHSTFVQSGEIELDSSLALYSAIPMKDGDEIPFFWEADEIIDNTIPPFATAVSNYVVRDVPPGTTLEISVRLLFRTFPPHILREIGLPELVDQLIVFEMDEQIITVAT